MQLATNYSLALLLGLAATLPGRGADGAAGFSASGAQAILDKNCVKCHGPLEHKGGLELDTLEAALRGNDDGPVIVPGHPGKSKLIAALAPDADPHMPPRKQLTAEDIAKLRAWVAGLKNVSASQAVKPGQPMDVRRIPTEPTAAIDYLLAVAGRVAECGQRRFAMIRRLCGGCISISPDASRRARKPMRFSAIPNRRSALGSWTSFWPAMITPARAAKFGMSC